MSEPELDSLRSDVADLRRRVTTLEQRAQVQPSLSATQPVASPSAPATTQHVHAAPKAGQPKFFLLRALLYFLGAVWLLSGLVGLSYGVIALGAVSLIVAAVWPFRTPGTAVHSSTTAGSPAHVVAPHGPRQRSGLEIEFAEHWLSWLGILSLVVGISFLLQYAFRSFGPWGNVLTAYATAAMLFGLWAYFASRFRNFAFILQGGAWATVFITTLSLRTISGGTLLPPALTTLALLAVTAAMIVAALIQHSRTLTGGAFLLGYVGALTGPVDSFTLVAFLGLAIGLALVSALWSWPELMVIGNLVAYFANGLWFIHVNSSIHQHVNFGLIMLIAEAVVFGGAHWIQKKVTAESMKLINLGAAVNLTGFFILFTGLSQVSGQSIWIVSGFLTIICGLLALAAQITPSRRSLRVSYLAFMSAFLTMTIFQKLHGSTVGVALLAEAVALTMAGIYSRVNILRWCGYGAAILSFFSISDLMARNARLFGSLHLSSALVLGGLATLGYLLIAWANRKTNGRPLATSAFVNAAILMSMAAVAIPWPAAWHVGVWAVIGLIAVTAGSIRGGRNIRLVGNVVLIISVLAWLATSTSTEQAGTLHITARVLSGLVVIAALALAAWRTKIGKATPPEERLLAIGQWWGAVFVLTILLGVEITTNWLSVAWGIEGMILVIIGLSIRSVTSRRQGLAILVLTIAKVYLYDIQTLPAFARILSFIALGCLLLGVGYWYNRSRKSLQPPPA